MGTLPRGGGHLTALLVCLLLGPLLAGCIGTAEDEDPVQPASNHGPAEERTNLTVTLVDPGQVPVPDQPVLVRTQTGPVEAITNLFGSAHFHGLAPGNITVEAEVPGFKPVRANLTLLADTTLEHVIELKRNTTKGFVQELTFEGFFDCSATYLIITGDCFVLVTYALGQAGFGQPIKPTNEQYVYPFTLHPGWNLVRITQTWKDPDAALGSMMRVNLEPLEGPDSDGHSERYGRAEGASPVTLEVRRGERHDTASSDEMVLPPEGAEVQTRTFHLGLTETQQPAGTSFLGAGIAYQQRFTVHIEIHYDP